MFYLVVSIPFLGKVHSGSLQKIGKHFMLLMIAGIISHIIDIQSYSHTLHIIFISHLKYYHVKAPGNQQICSFLGSQVGSVGSLHPIIPCTAALAALAAMPLKLRSKFFTKRQVFCKDFESLILLIKHYMQLGSTIIYIDIYRYIDIMY